jgi:ABC-type transport system involved in multi-copper enzyme maturation permease subunit
MTAIAHPHTFDVSQTPGIPFLRLFRVEMRKSADTRAGRWLIGITIGLCLIAEVIFLLVAANHSVQDVPASYGDFVAVSAFVSSVLLPVLGIMLVTSEWSQRTAMTTFSLEPRRMRIVMAKMLAGVTLTLFVLAFALVVGLVCNLILGAIRSGGADWTFGWTGFLGFLITQTFAMLGGFALACLLLNTPAAIVVFFAYKWVLPVLFFWGGALMGWFKDLSPWIDFQNAQGPLYELPMSGSEWGHLMVSGFIWLVVPLAIGLWRIPRAEVK